MTSKTFRIPLFGPYNNRISSVNTSDTSSGYIGVGIIGLMIIGKSSQATDKDARYVNCFAHTISDTISGTKKVATVKRPGWGTQDTPATGKYGSAILVWTGQGTGTKRITAFDDGTNSTIYDGTTSLGAITGKATAITETFVGATPTLTITSSDNTLWGYDTSGGLAKITDADYPGNAGKTVVGQCVHLEGFACVMCSDGTIGASDLNSVIAWTATSYATDNAYPDKGIGLVRHKDYIMSFGTESIEFWQNAGLTPFPLQKAGSPLKVGAVSADAIAQISDTIFWAGSTPQGGLTVFMYDGTISRISTSEQDSVMLLAGASNISLTTYRIYGLSFVQVKCGATKTLCYCVEEKFWFEISTTTPLVYKSAGISMGSTMVNYAVSNVSTSGKVYLQNQALLVFTDDGTTYTARIQTANQDEGTDRKKFYHELNIVADVEGSSSDLAVAYSDDDFATWTTWGTVDLSGARPLRLTRGGASRQRAWAFIHSANTPMRLHRAEGTLEIGMS